jgi:hypothetical protein
MSDTTVAYAEMKECAEGFRKIFRSAVCSGIVGDRAHQRRGSYHCGRKFCPPGHYSIVRPDDKAGQGPDDGSSAIDMTMSAADMKLATQRVAAAWADKADPRRKYLNAVNGWLGSGDATRFDFVAGTKKRATDDHKWHMHLEQRRRWIRDETANAACWSILRGESVATWLRSRGVIVPARPASAKPVSPSTVVLRPPPYPGHALRRNDKQRVADPAVRAWQSRMIARGWTSIGPADGFAGKKFEQVARAWQKSIRLPVDGVVGPQTWPTPWTRPFIG